MESGARTIAQVVRVTAFLSYVYVRVCRAFPLTPDKGVEGTMRIENRLIAAAASAESRSKGALRRGKREEAAYFAGQAEALRLALYLLRENSKVILDAGRT